MLNQLREATGPAHSSLDAAFGALDLHDREDYVRFLSAHAIGMRALEPLARSFAEGTLSVPCPEFHAMLAHDLAGLGLSASGLPERGFSPLTDSDAARAGTAAGVAYVVAGSRLGLAVIRREGYWGADKARPSAYMEDETGLALWKQVSTWLRSHDPEPDTRKAALAAAGAAFDHFAAAFAACAARAPETASGANPASGASSR